MKKFFVALVTVVALCCLGCFGFSCSAATVNSVKTYITKCESKPKGFKVSWKTKTKIKGYQIQYSSSSKFKKLSVKTKTVSNAKANSVTVSKLKGCNAKYYVRVRTYKLQNGKKVYSEFSKVKKITTENHKYLKATCKKSKVCKYCKKTSGKALGHRFSKGICKLCNKVNYADIKKDIAGYYWYLDGYNYTYLYPTVIPWYDHESLRWESENIEVLENKLTAFENYDYNSYAKINSQAQSNTHNTLLVNPVSMGYNLVKDYCIRVEGSKLYMVVGNTEYSFTRSDELKPVNVEITTPNKELTVTAGDEFEIDFSITPFWTLNNFKAESSNTSAVNISYCGGNSSDGKSKLFLYSLKPGTATVTVTDEYSNSYTTVNITVLPKKVTDVELSKTTLELFKGQTETLTATVKPFDATNKKIKWSSNNSNIVSVSSNGTVTAKKLGTAVITAKSEDGKFTACCTVVVKQKPLEVSASIGVSIRTTSTGVFRGVVVNANASNGSENYVDYYIKLYLNGSFVGEVASNEMFVTPLQNGTYTAEVYVKDSDGHEAYDTKTAVISY